MGSRPAGDPVPSGARWAGEGCETRGRAGRSPGPSHRSRAARRRWIAASSADPSRVGPAGPEPADHVQAMAPGLADGGELEQLVLELVDPAGGGMFAQHPLA